MNDPRAPRQPLVPPGGADLHVRDMTATFAADVSLGEAQRQLAEIGQWLPIDGPPESTLGNLVDHDSTGPLRLGYGAWRDLLLGVQFTNGKGELITAGGRTVKNVAGYDLTKFMVGQHGCFGTLMTITTRTYKRPDESVTAEFECRGSILPAGLLSGPLRPHWTLYVGGTGPVRCGYHGDGRALDWYESRLKAAGAGRVERREFEREIADRSDSWCYRSTPHHEAVFRASVPPARLGDLRLCFSRWSADPAFGIVVGVTGPGEDLHLHQAVDAMGGSVRLGDAQALQLSTSPAERRIIERLKDAFDPDGRLTPLPWSRTG